MQVFNGVMIENKAIPRLELLLGHLVRSKTTSAQQRETKIEILHADYKLSPTETSTAFGSFQDQPVAGSNTGFADNSNAILGLRADGAHPLGADFKLLCTAEYAKQTDYAEDDDQIEADYAHLGVRPGWRDFYMRMDYELRGSNDGLYRFQTPLGTNHLFHGWVDQFSTILKEGLRDTFISLDGKLRKLQFYGEYHRFRSDFGNIEVGREVDLSLSYPLLKQLTGKLEYANYRGRDLESGKRDIRKIRLFVF